MVTKNIQAEQKADVMIIGGGMVGISLAIALAQSDVRVTVVDKEDLHSQLVPEFDGRVSAISLGSQRVLNAIGAWDAMLKEAEPILDIRVADGDSTAHVHYNYQDVGDAPMGHMVENRHIRTALLARARELPALTLLAPMQVKNITRDQYSATITLTDGAVWKTPLVIAADGKRSRLRAECGIKTIETSYDQTAIVCTIEHEIPHGGLALERFLPAGPFAALPMKGNRSALVWTEPQAKAPQMLALNDDAFVKEINARLGDFLGKVTPVGKRFSYPLHLILATRYIDTRLALIGDAAHAIHPIAGQGVNVGFRDVAALTELILDAQQLGLDIGSQNVLEHYQRWRRFDSMSMGAITDGINRLFSNDRMSLRVARDTGLRIVNNAPVLKRFFMQHAMGLLGDLPKMMQAAA
jgi:2-octaprenyl-6-methoxyphenol hydroxylase